MNNLETDANGRPMFAIKTDPGGCEHRDFEVLEPRGTSLRIK